MEFSFESKPPQPDNQSVLPSFSATEVRPMTFTNVAESHTLAETGVLLLDSTGTVLFSNQNAREHCEHGDGLSIDGGTLQINTCDGRFRGANLHQFALKSEREVHFIPRNGKTSLELRFLPLPVTQLAATFLICLLRDEEHEHSTQLRLLCLHYRLSPAEIQLCILLLNGHSLSEAAIQLSATYNAVRARLKRIFEKTGVQRQTDLIRLLLYRSIAGRHQESNQSVSNDRNVTSILGRAFY